MRLWGYEAMSDKTLTIDGRAFTMNGERNLLETIRRANIELPTFCYHSDLSIYGACRLCLVEVEGRGIVPACSTPPEAGMVVRTTTEEIREMRRITVELLLANHNAHCASCGKSAACQLQGLARRLGVERVRFKPVRREVPVDRSSPSLVRDPNKCVLCGDCVRVCAEVQGVGAIDFIHRGSRAAVGPAFGKDLHHVECVTCGQCASVCPTGALVPKSSVEDVWKALDNKGLTVVAQIAPAVRVALGECFGLPAGAASTGRIVAALRALGFAKVYDTAFAADLTVIEEANEFLKRRTAGARLPQFTSCCPGWVKFAEQYFPGLLRNLSSCRSPQQMFGALAKETLPAQLGVERRNLRVVAIMPCTAKKFEARRPEFQTEGQPDVDHVLTTQELARMIEERGLRFDRLEPESLDMPFGYKTGAGVIFGSSGGVSEAVLRYATEVLSGVKSDRVDYHEVRGEGGLREAVFSAGGTTLKLAVVSGLRAARELAERIQTGTYTCDFVEVMACPGGCVGGAGQPVTRDAAARRERGRGLYAADKELQLHKSQDNPAVARCYAETLGEPNSPRAHALLHTEYRSRRRIAGDGVALTGAGGDRLPVRVCVGTSCFVRGSQALLQALMRDIQAEGLEDRVDLEATFCFEACNRGPTVRVGDDVLERCTYEKARDSIRTALAAEGRPA